MLRKKNNKKDQQKKEKSKKTPFFSRISRRYHKVKDAMFCDLDEKESSSFSVIEVVVIILISILFGIVIGYMITYGKDPLHGSSGGSNLREVINAYQGIVDDYYDDLDQEKLANAAIKGMISSLDDPYSSYMNRELTDDFNETVDGSFIGIGVVIAYEEDYSRIIDIYDNSPAFKAGLKVDDRIVEVDGEDVKGYNGDQLSSLIRGKRGTKVVVSVQRGEEKLSITMSRDVIDLPSVYDDVFEEDNKKIGYIQITTFAANTYDQFKKSLLKLEKDHIQSLIIDVRDNPGGHLLQTKEILSLFFPKKTVLYQIETKNLKQKVYSNTDETRTYPIAILINSASASASEILASCFQENYKKSFIVGSTSYGKGTVQKSLTLSSGTSIKYTTQKWLTSKGIWLENKGVVPDYVVNQADEFYEIATFENDTQLQEAIKQIKES